MVTSKKQAGDGIRELRRKGDCAGKPRELETVLKRGIALFSPSTGYDCSRRW